MSNSLYCYLYCHITFRRNEMIEAYKSKIENNINNETYLMLVEDQYVKLKSEFEHTKKHVQECEKNYKDAKKKMNKNVSKKKVKEEKTTRVKKEKDQKKNTMIWQYKTKSPARHMLMMMILLKSSMMTLTNLMNSCLLLW